MKSVAQLRKEFVEADDKWRRAKEDVDKADDKRRKAASAFVNAVMDEANRKAEEEGRQ